MDYVWEVEITTTSEKPCPACVNLESVGVIMVVTDHVEEPDVDDLKPHESCECAFVPTGYVELVEEDDYEVREVYYELVSIEEDGDYPHDVVHNYSRTEEMNVDIEASEEISDDFTLATSVSVEGDVEGLHAEARSEHSHSESSSSTVSSSSSITLEPGQSVIINSMDVTTTIEVWGTLYEVSTDRPIGNEYVGQIEFVDRVYYVDEIIDR